MTEEEGIQALRETVEVLDRRRIDYWVGRGLLRHFKLHGEFGDKQSDIDLHIHRRDEGHMDDVVDELDELGYTVTWDEPESHKLSLERGSAAIEFVFLDCDPGDPSILCHRTIIPDRKTYRCKKESFGDRRIKMFGIDVRVPENEYLPSTFGPKWRDNQKGSGGTEEP